MHELFADIHVHASVPLFGDRYLRQQQFLLRGDQSTTKFLYCVSFYEVALPTAARSFERLCNSIRHFHDSYAADIITTRAALRDFLAKPERRVGYILCVESLRPVPTPAHIETLWALGIRSFQPAHFWDNRYTTSYRLGLFPQPKQGISQRGMEILSVLAERYACVDLAHMSRAAMEDVLNAYTGPIICSHTGSDEQRHTPRNIAGDLAATLAKRGGLVGVTPWKVLLAKRRAKSLTAWLDNYADTLAAFLKYMPQGHLAVGSDRGAPVGIDPAFFQREQRDYLIEALRLRTGHTSAALAGILGQNAIAFWERTLPA